MPSSHPLCKLCLRKTQSNLSGDAIIYCHRAPLDAAAITLIRLFEFLKNVRKGLALQAKKLKRVSLLNSLACGQLTLNNNRCISENHRFYTVNAKVRKLLSSRTRYIYSKQHKSNLIINNRLTWWRMTGSNRRPPACKAGALPAELIPHTPLTATDLRLFP